MIALMMMAALAADPNADDLAKFAGTWRHESLEVDGKAQDISEFRDTPLVLTKGRKFTQGEAKGTFAIDAEKTPKTIDLTFTEGPLKGVKLKGIYELDDATYKLCVAAPGTDRPKVFDSKAKGGGSVQVLKKDKP